MKLSFWDILASMVMLAGLAIATIFINIFVNPYSFINPFPPPTPVSSLLVPTLTPSPRSLPVLWTGTPETFHAMLTNSASYSATPSATSTITSTLLVLPSKTPTRTKTKTPVILPTKAATKTGTSADDDTTRPSTPSNLKTTSSSTDSTPTFTWTASTDSGSGIDYYELSWGTTNACVGSIYKTDSTSWTRSILRTNGVYYVCVGAVDKAGNHSYATGPVSFTFVDTTPPTVPGLPKTTSLPTDTTPTFTWTASTDSGTGLFGYYVSFNTTNSCTYTYIYASKATYTPPALTANGTYYICVTAIDYEWNESDFSGPVAFTLSGPVAPTATTSAATAITSASATLNGTVNANNLSTMVNFQYGPTSSYGSTVSATPSTITGSTSTSVLYNLSGLAANTTYHYRVLGTSSAGTTYGLDGSFTTLAIPTTTTITSDDPDPSAYGVSYTVAVTVAGTSGTPAGTVSVSDGAGATCTITLAAGSGSCPLTTSTAGAKTITATYNGGGAYSTSSTTTSHTVDKLSPVISFGAAPTPAFGGGNFSVTASTTNTDSTALSYTVDSGSCTLVSGSTFSSSGAGTCVVRANGAATTNFNAATQILTITIAPGTQAALTVAVAPASIVYGSTSAVSTTGGSGGGVVTFSVGASNGCALSGSNLSMTNIAGTCAVTATKAADANYNAITSDAVPVLLVKATPVITFDPAPTTTYLDANFIVSATTSNTENTSLTFSVVNGPCTWSINAAFIATGGGICVVRADGVATTNFDAVSETQSVTIDPVNQPALNIVDPSTVSYAASPITLTTSGGAGTGAVSFDDGSSHGCSVVDDQLTVTNVDGSGTCEISATKAATADYNSATSPTITVTLAP